MDINHDITMIDISKDIHDTIEREMYMSYRNFISRCRYEPRGKNKKKIYHDVGQS